MVEDAHDSVGAAAPVQAEDLLGFGPEFVTSVAGALDDNRPDDVDRLVGLLHYAELADLLELLRPDHRESLVERLRADFGPEILANWTRRFATMSPNSSAPRSLPPPSPSSKATTR